MKILFSTATARIFFASVICMALMLISSDGKGKESVRLACACFMILVTVITVKDISFKDINIKRYSSSVEAYVDDSTENSRRMILETSSQELNEYFEKKASEMDIDCTVDTVLEQSDDGVIVKSVTVKTEHDVERLTELIENELNIAPDLIKIKR